MIKRFVPNAFFPAWVVSYYTSTHSYNRITSPADCASNCLSDERKFDFWQFNKEIRHCRKMLSANCVFHFLNWVYNKFSLLKLSHFIFGFFVLSMSDFTAQFFLLHQCVNKKLLMTSKTDCQSRAHDLDFSWSQSFPYLRLLDSLSWQNLFPLGSVFSASVPSFFVSLEDLEKDILPVGPIWIAGSFSRTAGW